MTRTPILSLLFFILLTSCNDSFVADNRSEANVKPDGFGIVGGQSSSWSDNPYYVQLLHNGYVICGASIIDDKKALTAAHCLTDVSDGEDLYLLKKESDADSGISIQVLGFEVHPQFGIDGDGLVENDLAVLFLSEDFDPQIITPIELADESFMSQIEELDVVTALGSGLNYGTHEPGSFNQVDLQYIPSSSCGVSTDKLCTISTSLVGIISVTIEEESTELKIFETVCNGDSGGPLVYDGYLIGVASFVSGRIDDEGYSYCGSRDDFSLNVFSKVSSNINWINAQEFARDDAQWQSDRIDLVEESCSVAVGNIKAQCDGQSEFADDRKSFVTTAPISALNSGDSVGIGRADLRIGWPNNQGTSRVTFRLVLSDLDPGSYTCHLHAGSCNNPGAESFFGEEISCELSTEDGRFDQVIRQGQQGSERLLSIVGVQTDVSSMVIRSGNEPIACGDFQTAWSLDAR